MNKNTLRKAIRDYINNWYDEDDDGPWWNYIGENTLQKKIFWAFNVSQHMDSIYDIAKAVECWEYCRDPDDGRARQILYKYIEDWYMNKKEKFQIGKIKNE